MKPDHKNSIDMAFGATPKREWKNMSKPPNHGPKIRVSKSLDMKVMLGQQPVHPSHLPEAHLRAKAAEG